MNEEGMNLGEDGPVGLHPIMTDERKEISERIDHILSSTWSDNPDDIKGCLEDIRRMLRSLLEDLNKLSEPAPPITKIDFQEVDDEELEDWQIVVGAVVKAQKAYYAELHKVDIDGAYFPLTIQACSVWEGSNFQPRKDRFILDDRANKEQGDSDD
jgi:hypothetical protein